MRSFKNKTDKVILFDIDYTLFNAQKYREILFKLLADKLKYTNIDVLNLAEDAYFKSKKDGVFIPSLFLKKIIETTGGDIPVKSLNYLFWKKDNFSNSLYKEVKKVLIELSKDKNLNIGIFSEGYNTFQKKKINAIKDFLHAEHVYVFSKKNEKLKNTIQKYKNVKLFYVDDVLQFLKKAKEINKDIVTIWIKRGRHAEETKKISNFKPDATVDNLTEVVDIVKKQ